MSIPSDSIRAGYDISGKKITSPKDVEKNISDTFGGMKVKYINKTRERVLNESRALKYGSRAAFFSAGALGAIAVSVVIAVAKGALVATAIGSMATPAGCR